MPVTFFEHIEAWNWPPPPTPPAAPRRACPKHAPKCKRKPKPKPKKLAGSLRTVLIDRLEAAVERGEVDLHDDYEHCDKLCITGGEYALLLRILVPEEYRDPGEGRKPPKPTATAPGSADRIAEYTLRVASRRVVNVRGDATAHGAHDRGLAITQRRNGSGVKVVGWADEEEW